jgi:hypothetical protein
VVNAGVGTLGFGTLQVDGTDTDAGWERERERERERIIQRQMNYAVGL